MDTDKSCGSAQIFAGNKLIFRISVHLRLILVPICASVTLWLIVFQLFFHPLQKVFDRFIDSSLQPGADARCAHQSDTWMQLPRTLASKVDLVRDVPRP